MIYIARLLFVLMFGGLAFGQDVRPKCAETYLPLDTAHGGTDYGVAISQAVQASSLTAPTEIKLCAPGDHPIYTQAYFDRPIMFEMGGSKLIAQPTLGSTPSVLSNASVTAGSERITVSSTAGLAVNEAVGGLGITSGSYITAIGSSSITISLMPSLILNAYIVSGNTKLRTSSSLAGISVGQTVTGYGIPASTTITAVNLSEPQSITLSNAPTQSLNTSIALSVRAGGWLVPTLTIVKPTPVLVWGWNRNALQNEFGQMVEGSMRDVWIIDDTKNGIPGLQGVQIYGWDRFNAYNTRVEFIAGSGFILGGYNIPSSIGGAGLGSVRESKFFDTKVRYCGNAETGQPAMALISPFQQGIPGADEINEIDFSGGSIGTAYGESLTFGTYDPAHTGVNGPQLIWFTDDFQIEGGNYLSQPGASTSPVPAVATQFDAVHIIQGRDLYFTGGEIAVTGYGKALVRIDAANTVTISNNRLFATSHSQSYTVGVTNGSRVVHWVSSTDNNGFLTGHTWDGIAAYNLIPGVGCATPCTVHLDPVAGVTNSRTLRLASPFTGATNPSATFLMPTSGYQVNVVGPLGALYTHSNEIDQAGQAEWSAVGAIRSQQVMYVGQGPNLPGIQQTSDNAVNMAPVSSLYDAFTVPVGYQLASQLTNGHFTQRFFGQSKTANNSGVENFGFTAPGSANNFMSWQLYNNTFVMKFDGSGLFSAPLVSAPGGFRSGTDGLNIGITHTLTLPCGTATFVGGILTGVTGSC